MSQEFVPDDNKFDRPNDDSAAVSEQEVVLLTVVGFAQGSQGNHTHFVPTGICRSRRLEPRTACSQSEAGDERADPSFAG
ncbi:hypothetical protein [Microcoleus vaginatus]|uniref:hypothetical protein n=1 Tax=Microcoleus vaginatus TaxID=119532 RepID=UPI00403F3ECD